nr:unnamed protein product [Haemonchus contortus]
MKTTVLLTVFVLSIVIQSHHGEEIPLAPGPVVRVGEGPGPDRPRTQGEIVGGGIEGGFGGPQGGLGPQFQTPPPQGERVGGGIEGGFGGNQGGLGPELASTRKRRDSQAIRYGRYGHDTLNLLLR